MLFRDKSNTRELQLQLGNKDVGLEAPSCGLSPIEGRVNVEVGEISDGECNQHVDMEGIQSNQY